MALHRPEAGDQRRAGRRADGPAGGVRGEDWDLASHERAELGDIEIDGERRDLPVYDLPDFRVVLAHAPARGRLVVIGDNSARVLTLNDQLLQLDMLDSAQKARERLNERFSAFRMQLLAGVRKDDVLGQVLLPCVILLGKILVEPLDDVSYRHVIVLLLNKHSIPRESQWYTWR